LELVLEAQELLSYSLIGVPEKYTLAHVNERKHATGTSCAERVTGNGFWHEGAPGRSIVRPRLNETAEHPNIYSVRTNQVVLSSHNQARRIEAHGLGVFVNPTEDDMRRFERIEKSRLIEQHAAELTGLIEDVERWKGCVSGLRDEVRRRRKKEDHLMIALAALSMLVAYFYLRDFGCAAPAWNAFWPS
jgi:hypothetical protein